MGVCITIKIKKVIAIAALVVAFGASIVLVSLRNQPSQKGDAVWNALVMEDYFGYILMDHPFSTEAMLNKPGICHDLPKLEQAGNIEVGERTIIYKSHYDPDALVIITKGKIPPLDGESHPCVGLEIPSKHHTRPVVEVIVEFDNLPEEPDENILRALGYEGSSETGFYDPRTSTYYQYDGMRSVWTKGEIEIVPGWEINKVWTIVWWEDYRGGFRALINFENSLTPELENELKTILEAHGISGDVWEYANVDTWIYEEDLLSFPTVDIDPTSFDWSGAMKKELTWLRDIGAISGITDYDIESISSACGLRTAGCNARVVFHEGEWMGYNETGLPMVK